MGSHTDLTNYRFTSVTIHAKRGRTPYVDGPGEGKRCMGGVASSASYNFDLGGVQVEGTG